jgi:hypothetical protein
MNHTPATAGLQNGTFSPIKGEEVFLCPECKWSGWPGAEASRRCRVLED